MIDLEKYCWAKGMRVWELIGQMMSIIQKRQRLKESEFSPSFELTSEARVDLDKSPKISHSLSHLCMFTNEPFLIKSFKLEFRDF